MARKPVAPRIVAFKKRDPLKIADDVPDAAIYALRAFEAGVANDGQQKTALNFILFDLCGLRDLSFDPDNQRVSDFAEGARSVGLKIVAAMKLIPRDQKMKP